MSNSTSNPNAKTNTLNAAVELRKNMNYIKKFGFPPSVAPHIDSRLILNDIHIDAYLFITKDGSVNFGLTGLQTDDTLNVGIEAFMKKEETEIIEARFKAKTQTILETDASGAFNSCRMTIEVESIIVE